MGIKQVPVDIFLEYLKLFNIGYIRTKASHDLYDVPPPGKKLARPITIRTKYKDIPICHIHTNLTTLGKTHLEFEDWMKKRK